MGKSNSEIASLLKEIYEKEFGGKDRGRFKISRSNLRRLADKKRLEDSVNGIIDASLDIGYIVIDLGDYFAVVQEEVMKNYRPVPKAVLAQYVNGSSKLSISDDDE